MWDLFLGSRLFPWHSSLTADFLQVQLNLCHSKVVRVIKLNWHTISRAYIIIRFNRCSHQAQICLYQDKHDNWWPSHFFFKNVDRKANNKFSYVYFNIGYRRRESSEKESSCQTVYAAQWTKSNKAARTRLHPHIYPCVKPHKQAWRNGHTKMQIKGASVCQTRGGHAHSRFNHFFHLCT